MKVFLALATATILQMQGPEAIIECAEVLQEHNSLLLDEMSPALEGYATCMNAGRVDACIAEFRRLEEVQKRYELMIERLRRQCPDDQLRSIEGGS